MIYRLEYVRCGRQSCKSCPHGPYWYGYQRVAGRLRKRYYGRTDPRPDGYGEDGADTPTWAKTDAIWCCGVLGISLNATSGEARSAYMVIYQRCFGVPGKDAKRTQARAAHAWVRLCALRAWTD
jgi:hypothetical protein